MPTPAPAATGKPPAEAAAGPDEAPPASDLGTPARARPATAAPTPVQAPLLEGPDPVLFGPPPLPVPQPAPARPAQAAAPAPPGAPAAPPVPPIAASTPKPADGLPCEALATGRVTGRVLPAIADGECGATAPLEITAIGPVTLSGPATVTCAMATALADWLPQVADAAQRLTGRRLTGLVSGPGYECRKRNRSASGKLSEHGRANALDIAAFRFAEGPDLVVLGSFPKGATPQLRGREPVPAPPVARPGLEGSGLFLVTAHTLACARFTTVLGPDEGPTHADHLHLDTVCRGADCGYRLCQ